MTILSVGVLDATISFHFIVTVTARFAIVLHTSNYSTMTEPPVQTAQLSQHQLAALLSSPSLASLRSDPALSRYFDGLLVLVLTPAPRPPQAVPAASDLVPAHATGISLTLDPTCGNTSQAGPVSLAQKSVNCLSRDDCFIELARLNWPKPADRTKRDQLRDMVGLARQGAAPPISDESADRWGKHEFARLLPWSIRP
jgi:hypothetical protein